MQCLRQLQVSGDTVRGFPLTTTRWPFVHSIFHLFEKYYDGDWGPCLPLPEGKERPKDGPLMENTKTSLRSSSSRLSFR